MSRAIAEATHEGDVTPEREQAIFRLQEIPNIGPKMAAVLIKLGVTSLEDARSRDPDEMYHELCALEAKRHDPCMRDIFAAVVSYADGAPARPWWEFTPERKAREQAREEGAR